MIRRLSQALTPWAMLLLPAPFAHAVTGPEGDYNASGHVDQADFDLVLLNWGMPASPPPDGWLSNLPTGTIDHFEMIDLQLTWQNAMAPAIGTVGEIEITHVDPGAVLPGYTSNDVFISFEGKYTGSQVYVSLTEGTLFSLPPFTPFRVPHPNLISAFPELEFTTFAAQGSLTEGGPFGDPAPTSGAVNLGASADQVLSSIELNYTWIPIPDQSVFDQSDFLTARVTLSNDASGDFSFFTSAGGDFKIAHGEIRNGLISITAVIPEPPSVMLATGVAVCLTAVFRRRQRT